MFKIIFFFIFLTFFLNSIFAQINVIPINDGLNDLTVHCIAINPKNSKKIFAGTKSGLFRSNNGGELWKLSETDLSKIEISEIIIDPVNPENIYICTYNKGILKSTNDGRSWYEKNSGLPTNKINTLAVNLELNSLIYTNPDGYGIYKSIDGGNNWFSVGRGRDVRNFVMDPVNSNIAFAATVQSVLKTSDYGETWSNIGYILPSTFINGLAVDFVNPDILFLGPAEYGVWKTIDGGVHWFAQNNGLPTKCTAIAIEVNNINPDIIFLITDKSRLYMSFNGGEFWYELELPLIDIYINKKSFKIDPLNPEIIFIGTNGYGVFKIYNSYKF